MKVVRFKMNQEEQLIGLKYECLVKLGKAFLIDLIAINFSIFVNICSLLHLLVKNYFDCLVNACRYSFRIAKNLWIYFDANFKLIRYALRKAIEIITSNNAEQLQILDSSSFKNGYT